MNHTGWVTEGEAIQELEKCKVDKCILSSHPLLLLHHNTY